MGHRITVFAARLAALALLVVVPAVAVHLAMSVTPSMRVGDELPADDPVRRHYEEYSRTNDDQRFVQALLVADAALIGAGDEGGRLFELDQFAAAQLAAVPGVKDVVSLSTVDLIEPLADRLAVHGVFEGARPRADALQRIEQGPLWNGSLISHDRRAIRLTVELEPKLGDREHFAAAEALLAAGDRVERRFAGVKAHLLGPRIARYHAVQESRRSLQRIGLALVGLMSCVFYALFRSLRVVLAGLALTSYSFLATVIVAIVNEGALSPFGTFSLLFVLVVSTAVFVHLMSAMNGGESEEKAAPDEPYHARLKRARSHILIPSAFTTVTCVIGFLGLAANGVTTVRNLGLYSSAGAIFSFLVALYLFPFVCRAFNLRLPVRPPLVDVGLRGGGRLLMAHRHKILGACGVLAVVAFWGAARLEPEEDFYRLFVREHPLSLATNAFEKHFGRVGSIELIVKTKDAASVAAGSSQEVALLPELDRVHALAAAQPGVVAVRSLRSFYADVAGDAWPRTAPAVAQAVSFADTHAGLKGFRNERGDEWKVVIETSSVNTAVINPIVDAVLAGVEGTAAGAPVRVFVGGLGAIYSRISRLVVESFFDSFAVSLGLLFVMFAAMFRSARWAMLGLLADLMPVLIVGGAMALFDMPLSSDVIIVACAVLGLSVDDTVHFLWSFKARFERSKDLTESIDGAYREVTRSLVGTQLIFCLALPVFFLSDLVIFHRLAGLLVLGLVTALAFDLFILPCIAITFLRPRAA